jgi:hypothetical protein
MVSWHFNLEKSILFYIHLSSHIMSRAMYSRPWRPATLQSLYSIKLTAKIDVFFFERGTGGKRLATIH